MITPEVHPQLRPIAFLLGEWEGPGHGHYPTIDDFDYVEHLSFGHVGKPFITYGQRTRHPDTSAPMHAESGYLRLGGTVVGDAPGRPGHQVEMVVAQPTGMAEVAVGTVAGLAIGLASTTVVRTPTAKEVSATVRRFRLDGDVLHVDLHMAAVGIELTHHLQSHLRRVG